MKMLLYMQQFFILRNKEENKYGKEQLKTKKKVRINMVEQIIVYLITTVLGIALGAVTSKLKNNKEKDEKEKKKDEAIELGVQALLRNEIIRRYREFESKGEISILDQENLDEMFEQYKNLGGNGTVKKMMNDLYELKTKIVK